MLVMTAKLTKKKLIAWVLGIALVVCAVIALKGGNQPAVVTSDGVSKISTGDLGSPQGRLELLKGFGWDVSNEPLEFMEVHIPEQLDEVYNKYNEIQRKQGLDLSKYTGKRAMRYTYAIKNYPTGEQGIIANILVYKGKLIAGDVCSPQLNGFMHGLNKPSSK